MTPNTTMAQKKMDAAIAFMVRQEYTIVQEENDEDMPKNCFFVREGNGRRLVVVNSAKAGSVSPKVKEYARKRGVPLSQITIKVIADDRAILRYTFDVPVGKV